MPRKPATESAEDIAVREIDHEDTAAIDDLARQAGPPPDSEQLSDAEADSIWAITDPAVDANPDAFAQKLMTTGLSQQELPTLRVLKMHPEWAPLYGQPTQSAELADQYTRMARWPARWMVLQGIDDPDEQAREAERRDRRYQKAHAERMVQAEQPIGVWKPDGNEGMTNTFSASQDVQAVVPAQQQMQPPAPNQGPAQPVSPVMVGG